mgnify:CR=1 FL=1|jgi:hypothetical protein
MKLKLPKIQSRYEKNVNKFHYFSNGHYFAIPSGREVTIWFTQINNMPVCVEDGEKNTIIKNALFDCKLSLGTALSAKKFKYNNTDFYCITDIYYYKNQPVTSFNLNIMEQVFKQIKNAHGFIIFGFPLYNKNLNKLSEQIKELKYKVHCIQYRFNNKYLNKPYKTINKAVLSVKPTIKHDIYELYCKNNVFYAYALIPNLSISIKMNNIFRSIKENTNIDYIEESDDEDVFENIKDDKYIKLEETHMECIYNDNFNMWVPVSETDSRSLISKHEIQLLEK